MTIKKNVLSAAAGGVASVAFMLSCGMDMGASVDADAAPGSCGECTISGPLTVVQPLQMKTADADPARIVSGVTVPSSLGEKLADGPLILTDVAAPNRQDQDTNFRAELYVKSDGNCANPVFPVLAVSTSRTHQVDVHGARVLVKAGEILCARQVGTGSLVVSWSGFRPYE